MSLARNAVSGAVWIFATSVVTRLVGLFGTLLLTRYLTPDVYGEVSVAVIVVQTASFLSVYGLLQYILAKPDAGRAATFHATFYFIALGAVALGVTIAMRDRLGVLVGAPGMARFVPGLAFATFVDRIALVPERIQIRMTRFRLLAIQRAASALVFTVVTTTLAWRGHGGEAIVLGSIARSIVRLALFSSATSLRDWIEPHRLDRARTIEVFAFGAPMSIAMIAGFGSRYWDTLIFSSMFGPAAAGLYNLAYNLADIPASQVGDAVGDVLTGTLGKLRSREQRLRALVRSMGFVNLVSAPLAVGLAVVAPAVVTAFFDPRWRSVAPMLAILSALSVVRCAGWVGNAYLQVSNEPRLVMILEIARTIVLLSAMFVFGQLGPLWACAAVGVAFGAGSLGYLWAVRRVDGIPMGDMLSPLFPPLVACVPMALSVLTVHRFVAPAPGVPPALALALEIAAGAASFSAAALVLAPAASRELLDLIRGSPDDART